MSFDILKEIEKKDLYLFFKVKVISLDCFNDCNSRIRKA